MEKKKSGTTLRRLMEMLSLLAIVFSFCPSFMISCSGQNFDVSVLTAVEGVELYGEYLAQPQPALLICLILPVVIFLALLFGRKSDRKTAFVVLVCAAADTGVWYLFRSFVKDYAEKHFCYFETKPWFFANMIVLILIMFFSLLVLLGLLKLRSITRPMFEDAETGQNEKNPGKSGYGANGVSHSGPTGYVTRPNDIIGFCKKCGSPVAYSDRFCSKCGTPVPKELAEKWNNTHFV